MNNRTSGIFVARSDARARFSKLALLPIAILLLSASSSCSRGTYPNNGQNSPGMPGMDGRPVDEPGDKPAHDNEANEDPNESFVGALQHDLTYYETHGKELYNLVDRKAWYGHIRMRRCDGCSDSERTKVKIQAISNLRNDKLTGLPEYGRIVGRLINVGDKADATTHVGASGSPDLRDQFYFIIKDKKDAHSAELWVAHLTFVKKNEPRETVIITRAAHDFEKCEHPPVAQNGKSSEGDFRTCDTKMFFGTLIDRAWFSCDGGCCTASWPP